MLKSFSRRYASKAAFLFAAALMVSGCAAKLPSEGYTPWNTYLHDDARTNASPDKVPLPLKKAWDRDISAFNLFKGYPKEQLSSAALSGGVLFVGSTDNRFYSMDMATGKTLWKFDAGSPLEAPPAVTEDRVCFGSSDGVLRCFDRNGTFLWQFAARSEILSSPVIREGFVYFSSSDDRVYALNAATGEKAWNYAR
ncbi:MAG: PQQ-binding-like beta-propeller repeat protein, partial [Deltaproteobacteria bacterium]|nr:PQQ-binding-like beta-propeller repeat protein [Deltaproteobacteria bacterium]